MLTKYKNVRPKKDVNKPFERYFPICGVFRNFFREGAPNFDIFSGVVFSDRIDLFPPPLVAKICCYGGQAIRLRLVKSIAFQVRLLENCSRKINLKYLLGISIVHID